MEAYLPLNEQALEAFDELAADGVAAPVHEADPFLVCFRSPAERHGLLRELDEMQAAGQKVDAEPLGGGDARRLEPALSERVGAAVLLRGQRYTDPGAYLRALADAVRARGGEILEGVEVHEVREIGDEVVRPEQAADRPARCRRSRRPPSPDLAAEAHRRLGNRLEHGEGDAVTA
jgi:D-amino-acid dehydrogenase